MPKNLAFGAFFATATLLLFSQARASETALLSLKGVSLKDGQYIEKFEIDTWGVGILAVCHIPGGWIYTAGHNYDLSGILSGEAQGGMAYTNRYELSQFDDAFLIVVDRYQKWPAGAPNTDGHPATFSGFIEVGAHEADETLRKIELAPSDFTWVRATGCPAPLTQEKAYDESK